MTDRNPGNVPSADDILSMIAPDAPGNLAEDATDAHAADANRTTSEIIDDVVREQLAAESNSPPASTLASTADDQRPISTESQEAVAALVLRDFGLLDDDDASIPDEAELDRLYRQDATLTPAPDNSGDNAAARSTPITRLTIEDARSMSPDALKARCAQPRVEYSHGLLVLVEMADDARDPVSVRNNARRELNWPLLAE